MDKRYYILIIIIWICNAGVGQDFSFRWEVHPFLAGRHYTVNIEKKARKSYITIKEGDRKDSTFNKMNLDDCDSLKAFLDKYPFQTKGNTIYGPIQRVYQETKVLADTNWIQINGDSLRRDLIWIHGYCFDKTSNRCYREYHTDDFLTDGTTYCGAYITNNTKKKFYIHSGRLSVSDVFLNHLMYNLIRKYDFHGDYQPLKQTLDEN